MNKKILAGIALVLLVGALVMQFLGLGRTGEIVQMILVALAAILGFVVFGKPKNYQ